MQIYNSKYIRTLNPCEDGITNFEKHYPRFNDKLSKLLSLKKIPYDDKVWLATKVSPIGVLRSWAVLCAETQLHKFEKQFPNDTRVRDCIDTIKSIKDLSNPTSSEKEKLNAAKCAAKCAARCAANATESAAWNAAWSAAWSASLSADIATESIAWRAANAAAAAKCAAGAAGKNQEEVNIKILIKLLKEKEL